MSGFNLKDLADKAKKAMKEAQPYLDLAKTEAEKLGKEADKKLQEFIAGATDAPKGSEDAPKGDVITQMNDGPDLGKSPQPPKAKKPRTPKPPKA